RFAVQSSPTMYNSMEAPLSQIAQQVVKPTAIDPNCVPETYSNGPVNLNITGPCATLTFTTVRADIGEVMSGKQATTHFAVVTGGVTMPLDCLVKLRDLLNKTIQNQPMAPGSTLKQ